MFLKFVKGNYTQYMYIEVLYLERKDFMKLFKTI